MSSPDRETVDLIYEIEGTEEIDVFQFAPILISLGSLIQETNRTLYPNAPDVAINIRPFKKASFLTEIVLFAQASAPLLPQIAALEILGIIAGLPTNLLEVIRKLGGKISKVEEIRPGEIRYYSDDSTIIVNDDIHQLIQNPRVRNSLYDTFARPLEQARVKAVKSFLKGNKKDSARTVAKEEADAISHFARTEPPPLVEAGADTAERESVVLLNPKRGSFDGEGGRWSFRRGDATITATMKDRVFLEKQARGDYRLHGADLLRVRLVEKQRLSGTEVNVTYEIPEVLEYRPGPKQPLLDGWSSREESD